MTPGQIHAVALAITLLSEGLGMAALSAASARQRQRWARNALAAVGINLVTHTLFWYTQDRAHLLLAESVVVGVEAVGYALLCGLSPVRAGAFSLALNLVSYGLGVTAWRVLLGA